MYLWQKFRNTGDQTWLLRLPCRESCHAGIETWLQGWRWENKSSKQFREWAKFPQCRLFKTGREPFKTSLCGTVPGVATKLIYHVGLSGPKFQSVSIWWLMFVRIEHSSSSPASFIPEAAQERPEMPSLWLLFLSHACVYQHQWYQTPCFTWNEKWFLLSSPDLYDYCIFGHRHFSWLQMWKSDLIYFK